jgi:hypothetical protein
LSEGEAPSICGLSFGDVMALPENDGPADFLRLDRPGVTAAAVLGLELAGEEKIFSFQATLRPGVEAEDAAAAAFFFADADPAVGKTEGLFKGEGL